MPTPKNKPTNPALQLHVKLARKDALKLNKLSRQAKLTLSEVIRSMIRSTVEISPTAAR